MTNIHNATLEAIHDAISLRGLTGDGGGFIRTTPAEAYMSPARLAIAREVARYLPADATVDNAAVFVDRLAEVVMKVGKPDADDIGGEGFRVFT